MREMNAKISLVQKTELAGERRERCAKSKEPSRKVWNYEERDNLILNNRERARKIARSILRRWGISLSIDEIDSAADLALCEAAHNYQPVPGAAFVTYLYYYIKGALIETLNMERFCAKAFGEPGDEEAPKTFSYQMEELDEEHSQSSGAEKTSSDCPEKQTYVRELRLFCNKALGALNELERKVVIEAHIGGTKMAPLARDLGYSRGYLFSVRKTAVRKMRHALNDFDFDMDLAA